MQPINLLALAIALSGLWLAAAAPINAGPSVELGARNFDNDLAARDMVLNDGDLAALYRRAPWTRAQEASLAAAKAEYARLNALRGHAGFDQAAWLRAQTKYNNLQTAKTASGSTVGGRDLDSSDEEQLTRRAAWTRAQEAALAAAKAEYARLNALRGHAGFDQAAWLRAQTKYNNLQTAKTASGSTVGGRNLENLEEFD
ncbi:hypothetical protein CALCODRAFT_481339 [Calocera cornea HHB12733]|uniref:Uncharacterized protein n=1 Tax=Calocera cornea HHB12733 TaxID=1353952 RepID=A0A165HR23_9BASI|nr:hypothetical protein CALCODRAFT_481339 [Calocera cornea HHB12733]